ncbi:MAG: ADP-ribosylglycohydrolase family protein [Sphaerochaetaceae bacterium]
MDARRYLEKVYGGLLGKCVGVRLGAPVEPLVWTYDRIHKTYGEITGYIKDYREFAADDDINGPVFFIRALLDNPSPIGPKEIGRAWLNYTREEIGFYWWGGYGRSTEHTAYLNLKSGLDAPVSGSMAVNGSTVAEQIGGQIFIDSWGWVFPIDYKKAATYGGYAASVGHDGSGIHGGQFIAACNSLAFDHDDIHTIVRKALTVIPAHSEYMQVALAVIDFHKKNPHDWRSARQMLEIEFGYDLYAGDCHIIPNAGACVLALLYGNGDFSKTVEIATMCGWDTDCNAGNVGSILGVMLGPENIPEQYRKPINDFHAASSISGALNILNLPNVAKEIAILGLREQNQGIPNEWLPGSFSNDIFLDFSLPGSTGGIRTSPVNVLHVLPDVRVGSESKVSIIIDELPTNQSSFVFFKPYYTRGDFDDERYSPTFSPLAYPGQELKISGTVVLSQGVELFVAPYIRDSRTGEVVEGPRRRVANGGDFSVDWQIGDTEFAIHEIGLVVLNIEGPSCIGKLEIRNFSITGKATQHIPFSEERPEFKGLSRCSLVGGGWRIEDNGLRAITPNEFHLYTGRYYTVDSHVRCTLVPEYGHSHLALFRSSGAERSYYFGLHGEGKVALLKRNHTITALASAPFEWDYGKEYCLEITIEGSHIECLVDGRPVVSTDDGEVLPYGMTGVAKLAPGRTLFLDLSIDEL